MLIMYIHVALRSRILRALPSRLVCVQIDKNKIIAYARHLDYSFAEKLSEI
jgi:hypothetical protein